MVQWLCPHQVGDGDDPGRDRRNRREPERDHGPDPPADDEDEDEEERPRRTCTTLDVKRQRMAWDATPLDTGFGDVAEAPSRTWRLARMGQRSSMGRSVQTCPGKGYTPRAVDPASSSHMTKEEKAQRRQLQC